MFPKIKTQISDQTYKKYLQKHPTRKKLRRSQSTNHDRDTSSISIVRNYSKNRLKAAQSDATINDKEDQSQKTQQNYKTKQYIRKLHKIQSQTTPNKIQLSIGCNNSKCKICKKYLPNYDRNYDYKHRMKVKPPLPHFQPIKISKKIRSNRQSKGKTKHRRVLSVVELQEQDNPHEKQQIMANGMGRDWVRKIIRQNYEHKYRTQPHQFIPLHQSARMFEIGGKVYQIISQDNIRSQSRISYKSNRQLIDLQDREEWKRRLEENKRVRQLLNQQVSEYIKYETVFYIKKAKKFKKQGRKIQKYVLKKGQIKQLSSQKQDINEEERSNQEKPKNLEHMNIDIELKQYKVIQDNSVEESEEKKQFYSIKFPQLQKVDEMIRKYQSLTGQLDLNELLKSKSYYRQYSSEPGKQFLYFGNWDYINGWRNGYGVYVSKNIILQGYWKKGYLIKGAQLRPQSIYKGEFKKNKKHGQGQCKWLNGEEYLGEWSHGVRHGPGFWSSKNGVETYSGQWTNGKVTGYGQYYKKNQYLYKGQFIDFVKNGSGVEIFPNGDRYQGDYKEGQPHGKGKYRWECGLEYEGEFKNGTRVGKGCLIKEDIFELQGQFSNQRPNGICRLKLNNGDSFSGKFVFGQKYGYGSIQYGETGLHESGFWNHDVLKQKISPSKYTYKDEQTYF